MKKPWKIVGGLLVGLILVLLMLRVTGLNTHERIPGLWLTGTVTSTPVTDWSYTDKYREDLLQTSRML